MNCPRDNAVLRSVRKGRLEVNVCDECSGFSVLLKQEAAVALEKQLDSAIAKSGDGNQVETLLSPYTGETMKRFLYRGIQLDYCVGTHSIWFDRGEYSRMFQGPVKANPKPLARVSSAGGKAYDAVDNTVTTFEVVGVVEEVIEALFSGMDFFS